MTDKPLWLLVRNAWRDAISGTTLDGLDVRNARGWQAATQVAVDAERARCLAILREARSINNASREPSGALATALNWMLVEIGGAT